jgi:hypothetical protein
MPERPASSRPYVRHRELSNAVSSSRRRGDLARPDPPPRRNPAPNRRADTLLA